LEKHICNYFFFSLFLEIGFHSVAQVGLELPGLSVPPASASQGMYLQTTVPNSVIHISKKGFKFRKYMTGYKINKKGNNQLSWQNLAT
jgi:hypothetical protein